MTVYKTHEAKTHLSRILDQVLAGEEVIIARRDEPIVRLVPYAQKYTRKGHLNPAKLSEAEVAYSMAPLDEDDLAGFEKEDL